MADKHASWFKFYPADFMNGVRGLSAQEVGLYTMILCRIYEESGPVEYNPLRLATYCGMREKTFVSAFEKLVALGKLTLADGMISNARAEAEISNRAHDLKNAITAGKASAEKRQQKQRLLSAHVERALNHTDSDTDTASAVARAGAKPENQPSDQTTRERLLAAIGADPISGMMGPNGAMLGRQTDMQTAAGWSDLGLTIDQQCRIIGERMANARAKAPHFVPRSFAYFTGAMQDAVSARSTAGAAPRKSQSTGPFGDPTLDWIARQVGKA